MKGAYKSYYMKILDRYIFKSLLIATLLISFVLAGIIFLTQSLRFLELVINSGASTSAFWILTLLALPRFFEIILPVSLAGGIMFIYNKMLMDSEIVVMRASGAPPMTLARPSLMMAGTVVAFLWLMTCWAGPASLAKMEEMRQVIQTQYSALLFREGVFNAVDNGLTVYIGERTREGELHDLMIHDHRDKKKPAITILAKRGVMVNTPEGQQVVVYDGTRQDLNEDTGTLNKLDFSRYTIDLPEGKGTVHKRWREPDERTLWQLLNPDLENQRDIDSQHDFMVEIHRRIIAPLLALSFTITTLAFLLLGPVSRRGQSWRVVGAVCSIVTLQGLFLMSFNFSQENDFGLVLMYLIIIAPIVTGLFILSSRAEVLRQKIMFGMISQASNLARGEDKS